MGKIVSSRPIIGNSLMLNYTPGGKKSNQIK